MSNENGKMHGPMPLSYRYGKEHEKKQTREQLRHVAHPMNVVRAANEMDMIIKPLNKGNKNKVVMKPKVKRSSEHIVNMYEEAGKLHKAEQHMDIKEMDMGHNMKKRIVNVKAFDGKNSFIRGKFMIMSKDDKPLTELMFGPSAMPKAASVEPKKALKAASVGDDLKHKFDELKNRIDLSDERTRMAVSILAGILLTIIMLIFFKTLFRLWVKLNSRRQDDDENRALLKGELDSIHPISIVYKN